MGCIFNDTTKQNSAKKQFTLAKWILLYVLLDELRVIILVGGNTSGLVRLYAEILLE